VDDDKEELTMARAKRIIALDKKLVAEYVRLWDSVSINPGSGPLAGNQSIRLFQHRQRYQDAGEPIGVPWQFVAVVHMMESGQRFTRHLHNGDPLTARTVQVPKGRPPKPAMPPFTWEESARDALKMKGLDSWGQWDVAGMLFQLERFNGWGYRLYHPETLSPYLWAGTSHYRSGKYVTDGRWSPTAVSRQIGAVALLRCMRWPT